MKPKKSKGKPTGLAKSITAAAKRCHLTPRTLRDLRAEGLPGFRVDGTVDLDVFWVAYLKRRAAKMGSQDLRSRKLLAEIDKIETATAQRKGLLIDRAWVAGKIQFAAGDITALRLKSEAEHPLKFAAAAGDVAACREIVRGVWDDVMKSLQDLGEHLKEGRP